MDAKLHKNQKEDRERYSASILASEARHKIIIAGAGTGKSFTFRQVLSAKSGDKLALTFINSLARDLQKDLGALADSYTFHAYCKKLLHRIPVSGIDFHFHYFPKLPKLAEIDATIIGNGLSAFEEAFHTLTEDDRISFYLERGDYYNTVSHCDAVYRVLKYFQAEQASLPSFSQIVVDEYQDFNPLEVAFIDELMKVSPALIAGDDDQAIYNFKSASPAHIRAKSTHPDFAKFDLPYCSRCTQVIVDAIHTITAKALELHKLDARIVKDYICFLPDKEADSIAHPKIIHASCSTQTRPAPYVSKFIEREIANIPQADIDMAREKGYPCVLIAGPSHYTKQVYNYLKANYTNIDYAEAPDKEVNILEGYKILIDDEDSNLGWRIVLECSDLRQKADIIRATHASGQKLAELCDDAFKNDHLEIVAFLRKLKNGDALSETEIGIVTSKCGCSIEEIKKFLDIEPDEESEEPAENTSISIKITTINGSKGLSANYVFLIAMNNGDFPKDAANPTDTEICQLIVGLTRTRKKCYLISNSRFGIAFGKAKSVFIDWINPDSVRRVTVNAAFFRG